MQTFDVTLLGFDGETDQTDHLVKWVRAKSAHHLSHWLTLTGLWDHVTIQKVGKDGKPDERWLAIEGRETFDDGVNVILTDVNDAFSGGVEVEYAEGFWQHTKEPFDPQTWIEESQAVFGQQLA